MFNFKEYITNKNDKLWPISHTFVPLFLFFLLRKKYKIDTKFQFLLIITIVSLFEFVELFAFMIIKEDTDESVWNVVFNDIGNGVIAAILGVLLYNVLKTDRERDDYLQEENKIENCKFWAYFIVVFCLIYGLTYSLAIFRIKNNTVLSIVWFVYTTGLFIATRYVYDTKEPYVIKELGWLYIIYCLYMSVAGFIPLVADVSVILMKYIVDLILIFILIFNYCRK